MGRSSCTHRHSLNALVFFVAVIGAPSINGFCAGHRTEQQRGALVATSAESTTDETVSTTEANREPNHVTAVVTARSVAALALLGDKGTSSLQRLEADPQFRAIADQRDRSFARLLVTIVERRISQIDRVLQQCQTKQPKHRRKDDLFVQACLRIGTAQLLFIDDMPAYAAVKETIDVLRQSNVRVSEAKIKFGNAVLRRISREGDALLATTTPMDNIAPWLVQEWKQSWGEEATKAMSRSFMEQSPIDISINYEPGTVDDNARLIQRQQIQAAFGHDTQLLSHGSIRVGESVTGAVSEWPLYKEGKWWVQDASAALPALALYNTLLSKSDNVSKRHVVDVCAAPGGKTAQLLSLGFGHVTAIELSPRRCRRLFENLERLNLQDKASVVIADGSEWVPAENESVDGVLVDVPCSATGTGSKRPDVLGRENDLGNLLETQERLANHCADHILRDGGILVYATCSVLKRESEDQIEKLIARGRNGEGAVMETVPFRLGEIPGFDEAIDENGWLRVLPGALPGSLYVCDGFFVARLKRLG